mmetsp:Transcript_60284/g.168370  ORF Transcript_60284/g.168370 Transcript_60284/m.168370 type:complete len:356 (+) Transcript_60284:69-1136(+)|eukprot:CAMPEP_0117571050 /NCGR_PEP_ID=MMETSP0784-20121206/59533_1 /TAXON_ID=39447 /ORGANISM="" /LENGTH=355 /DNA_ID=CAMNT_0005369161 /DNA_START=65 /DNA_END=1132 /DNA_ORIENTATION=+
MARVAPAALRASWQHLAAAAAPAARSSHSVTSMAGGVYAFGGEDAPRNAFDPFVHVFKGAGAGNPRAAWAQLPGPVPGGPLLGHGAAGLGHRLFVFGGRRGGANTFSGDASTAGETGELSVFDTQTQTWAQSPATPSSPLPEPRSFHAMCAAGGAGDGSVFLFGGCGVGGRLNDLWCLDPQSGRWRQLHPGGAEAPRARGGSALVAAADGSRLVLMFGFSGVQQGDLAVFDLADNRWKVLPQEEQTGDVPLPRSVFAAARAGDAWPDQVIVYGGERVASDLGHEGAGAFTQELYVLDLADLRWTALKSEGDVPVARGWMGMAPLETQARPELLLFGGLDGGNRRLGDTWQLTLEG